MRLKLYLSLLVFVLLLNYVDAACTGTSPPSSGNWVITDTTDCSDMNIVLNANVDINVTGNLTFTNVNLTLNGTADGGANISVYSGGKLTFNVSDENQLNRINSTTTTNEYAFVAYENSILRIDHTNISELGWTTALHTGGIYIETLNFTLTNSEFSNNFRAFILDTVQTTPSDIHISNITIIGSGSNPFYLWDEVNGAVLENINVGASHPRGIPFGGHNNTFINISITGTSSAVGTSGAALWRRGDGLSDFRQSVFRDSTFINSYDEAFATSTTVVDNFHDIFINSYFATNDTDNNDVTILFTAASSGNRNLTFINTTFNQSDVTLDAFSFFDVRWFLDVTVNSSEGNNVSGAIVEIYNTTGYLLENTTTDSAGRTDLLNITEYVQSSSGKSYFTNITINVSYPTSQFGTGSKSINLTSSTTVNIEVTENDVSLPNVTNITPSSGQSYSVADVITFGANITDDTTLGNSTINITRPDGTVEQYNLTQTSCHEYEQNYTVPDVSGNYLVTFIGNDFYGNTNTSQTLSFTVSAADDTEDEGSSSPLIFKGGGGTSTTEASGDCGDDCSTDEGALNIGDKIKFALNGIQHTVEITEISQDKDFIKIKITAHYIDDLEIKVNVGESLSIDVNRDGTSDIKFSLSEITNYLEAVVSLESINNPEEPIIIEEPQQEEEISKLLLSDYYVTIGVSVLGIIVIIIFAIVIRHHNHPRKMFKRKNPHHKNKKRHIKLIIFFAALLALIVLIIFYSSYVKSVSGEATDDPLIVEYNFTTSVLQDVVPFNVTFTSVYENCRDSIEEVNWDFDNDTIIDATGFTVTYQYNNSGNYTANATIVTKNSGNFSRLVNITAYNALLSLTFDDSHISQINTGLDAFNSFGVNATAFTVPEWVNSSKYEDDGFTQWTSYMSWDNISTLNASGWDIQSHGVGSGNYTYCVSQGYGADITAAKSNAQCNQLIIHPQLGQVNSSKLIIELNDSKVQLELKGYEIEGIAYPGGNYSPASLTETETYYDWGRTVGNRSNELPQNISNNYTIYTRPANDATYNVNAYRSFIDEIVTGHKWMVWNFHIIENNCGGTSLCINVSNTNQTIQYARNNSVRIVTMKQALSGSWKNQTR